MSRRLFLFVPLLLMGPFGAPSVVHAEPAQARGERDAPLSPETVRGHCSVCHSFQLVESQQLDRANWEWVMEDMIVKYGATWIDDRLRDRMVDYLVKHHGPSP
ncbi:MAG: hypothetical protein ACREJG_12225 [Candidatus Rokuibacteriota bacterium]